MFRTLILSTVLIALASCSTAARGTKAVGGMAVRGAGAVAAVPLEDLNLKRDRIPKELQRVDRIYPEVPPDSCFMIAFEIRELDAVLGPDEDAGAVGEDALSLRARLAEQSEDAALGAARDLAADQIPFRGLVRSASGANRHERKVEEAYDRGVARRTYLKGLGDAMGCDDARVRRELYADEERKRFLGLF